MEKPGNSSPPHKSIVLNLFRRAVGKHDATSLCTEHIKAYQEPAVVGSVSSSQSSCWWPEISCCAKLHFTISRSYHSKPPSNQQDDAPLASVIGSIKFSERLNSFKRAASFSHYVEAGGGELQAVETAREWMVDLSQLFLGQKFASGTYSRLYHGFYKQKAVAVKVIRPPEEDAALYSRLDNQFSHEVTVLSRLHHSNIIEFVAACKKPPVLCVITEYLPGGSLKTFLHKTEPYSLPLGLVATIALDVARGMEYLHSKGVIHRDLKSANLIMTDDLHIKVADFGVSCLESHRGSMKGYMGTFRWMAPEMIKDKGCSRKVDVYSFGIVLWELLTGLTPFGDMTPVQAAFAVAQKNARPTIPSRCPKELGRLMQQCWSTSPIKRPEFPQIVKILETFKTLLAQETHASSMKNT